MKKLSDQEIKNILEKTWNKPPDIQAELNAYFNNTMVQASNLTRIEFSDNYDKIGRFKYKADTNLLEYDNYNLVMIILS